MTIRHGLTLMLVTNHAQSAEVHIRACIQSYHASLQSGRPFPDQTLQFSVTYMLKTYEHILLTCLTHGQLLLHVM